MVHKSYFKEINNIPVQKIKIKKNKLTTKINYPLSSFFVNPEDTEEIIAQEKNTIVGTIQSLSYYRYLNPMIKCLLFIIWPISISYLMVVQTQNEDAWRVLVFILTLSFWLTEVIPIGITSLFPILVRCISGHQTYKDKHGLYIFCIVIFTLGYAKWNLHKRISIKILAQVEACPQKVIGGMIILAVLLSVSISDVFAVCFLMPICKYIIHYLNMARLIKLKEEGVTIKEKNENDLYFQRFASSLKLSIPFATSLGTPYLMTTINYKLLLSSTYLIVVMLPIIIQSAFCLWVIIIARLLGFNHVFQWKRTSENSYIHYIINEEAKELGKIKFPEMVLLAVMIPWVITNFMRNTALTLMKDSLNYKAFIQIEASAVLILFILFIFPSHLPNLFIFRKFGAADRTRARGFSQSILSFYFITQGVPWGEILFVVGCTAVGDIILGSPFLDIICNEVLNNNFDLDMNLALYMLFGIFLSPFVPTTLALCIMHKIGSKMFQLKGVQPIYFYIIGNITPCMSFLFRISSFQNSLAYASGGILKKQMFVTGLYMTVITNVVILFTLTWVCKVLDIKDVQMKLNFTGIVV